jgi:hypothetical protein
LTDSVRRTEKESCMLASIDPVFNRDCAAKKCVHLF